jgi:hypothetical protein
MINTPVVLLAYARPIQTEIIMETMIAAKVRKLYCFIDYPKEFDAVLIEFNQKVLSTVNSFKDKMEIIIKQNDINIGPFNSYNSAMKSVFEDYNEESIIFLEDDKLPSIDFYRYCEDLLSKYKNDERIMFISGMNTNGIYPKKYNYDYFYADINTPWGHAIWRRTYNNFKLCIDFINDEYLFERIKYHFNHNIHNQLNRYSQGQNYKGNPPSMEFFLLGPMRFLFNQVVIVPTKNLITDIGATLYTANGDDYKLLSHFQRKHYFKKRFVLTFPLRSPVYFYIEKISKLENPLFYQIRIMFSTFERSLKIIVYKGPIEFIKKAIRVFMREIS